jgi:hypothetical protein
MRKRICDDLLVPEVFNPWLFPVGQSFPTLNIEQFFPVLASCQERFFAPLIFQWNQRSYFVLDAYLVMNKLYVEILGFFLLHLLVVVYLHYLKSN